MKTYEVEIKEILSKKVSIEAENEEEALEKVKELYKNEDIVLDASDFLDKAIFFSKERQEMEKAFKEIYDYMVYAEEKHYEESDKPQYHIYCTLQKFKSLREKIDFC